MRAYIEGLQIKLARLQAEMETDKRFSTAMRTHRVAKQLEMAVWGPKLPVARIVDRTPTLLGIPAPRVFK